MGNGAYGQCGHGQWGTGGMGNMGNEAHRGKVVQGYGAQAIGTQGPMWHMGNGAYVPWALWAMRPMGPWVIGTFLPIASLLLDGFLQKFYWT